MQLRMALLALAALAASCVTINQLPPDARVMSVYDVDHYVKELHGKRVRLKGEVNECTSLTCQICDGPSEDDACLPLSFYADSDAARDIVEELYRFATITIEARVDAACALGYDPDFHASQGDEIIACTDRSEALEEARVISVDGRKPASKGRFDRYDGNPLQEAGPAAYETMRNVLIGLPGIEEDDLRNIKIYSDPDGVPGQSGGYIICACKDDDCTSRWPTRSGHTYTRSPANPYICTFASRSGDNWLLSR